MNFVQMVHDGLYKEETLSPTSRSYICGMRKAKECLENYKADCDPEEDDLLSRLVAELKVKCIDECIYRTCNCIFV